MIPAFDPEQVALNLIPKWFYEIQNLVCISSLD